MFESTETSGEAVVVGDHDGWVQGLEVEDNDRVGVKLGLRLQVQWNALGRSHVRPLSFTRRNGDEVERFRDAQHHRFDPILRRKHQAEVTFDFTIGGSTKLIRATDLSGELNREYLAEMRGLR